MSRRKPWDTSGPPQPRSKREKGRDQLFKEKKTGVPERDKPPKPGGLTGHDWQEVLTPIPDLVWEFKQPLYEAPKQPKGAWAVAIDKLKQTVREREEKSAVRGVIEDNALAREEPYHILGEVIRESPEKR